MAVNKRFVIKEDYTATVIIITVLFFIWGLLSNLNGQLVPYMKRVCQTTSFQNKIIDLSFFGAYLFMSLPAAFLCKKIGPKMAVVGGLLLCVLGTLLFYPAAEEKLFALFLIAIFILASGVTFLQVIANPYILLLGKGDTAASRLNLSQAFNSLGASLAPYISSFLLADLVLSQENFKENISGLDLESVEEITNKYANRIEPVYVVASLILLFVAFIFLFARFPKAAKLRGNEKKALLPTLKDRVVWFAVLAIFLYVGVEVSIAQFISSNKIVGYRNDNVLYYYWSLMMVGRFIGAFLLKKLRTSSVLFIAAFTNGALVSLVFLVPVYMAYFLILIGLFNSIMFPSIFSMGVRSVNGKMLGSTAVLMMAIVGGAIVPFIVQHLSSGYFYVIAIVCYSGIVFFALFARRERL